MRPSSADETSPEPVLQTRENRHIRLQLQLCNIIMIIFGLAAIGLMCTQFTNIGLDNYRQIDLRILGILYILVGLVGIYCVLSKHGSIVLKTIYMLSIAFSIGIALFYGLTTYRIVVSNKELVQMEEVKGFMPQVAGLNTDYYMQKVLVSSTMIGIGILATIASIAAIGLIEKLVIVDMPWMSSTREEQIKIKFSSALLTGLAFFKLILGFLTFGLAAFLEYEHQLLGGVTENYVKIGMDHLAAILSITSAIVDLYAIFCRRHNLLNLKVSICLSIITAVWCLKSIDNNAFPYFKNDITNYRILSTVKHLTDQTNQTYPQLITLIVHGCLIALLATLFMVSALTVFAAIVCLRRTATKYTIKNSYGTISILKQIRFLSALHIFWAICLLILALIGLCDFPWNGDFIGSDLLWILTLAFFTGIFASTNHNTTILIKFIMNTVCFGVALEKFLVTLFLIFESVTYSGYKNGNVTDQRTYIGQIALHSCQGLILLFESLTALAGIIIYGKEISALPIINRHSYFIHFCTSITTLFYGIVFSCCYCFFEFEKWTFGEVALEVPYYRLGNGPLAIVIFVVQIFSCFRKQFLMASAVLQIVISTIAIFVICSAMSNIFYLKIMFIIRESIGINQMERNLMVIAVVLTALAVLACLLLVIFGVISLLRSSYILHQGNKISRGSSVSPFVISCGAESVKGESPIGTTVSPNPRQQTYLGRMLSVEESEFINPSMHQISIQPIEEQTLYWSADENPYIYKSTKRIYSPNRQTQPYNIDSGYTKDVKDDDIFRYESNYASPSRYFDDTAKDTLTGFRQLERPTRRFGQPKSSINGTHSKLRIAHSIYSAPERV